nr:hypothetical protein [Tanacetum cinerariifolium]
MEDDVAGASGNSAGAGAASGGDGSGDDGDGGGDGDDGVTILRAMAALVAKGKEGRGRTVFLDSPTIRAPRVMYKATCDSCPSESCGSSSESKATDAIGDTRSSKGSELEGFLKESESKSIDDAGSSKGSDSESTTGVGRGTIVGKAEDLIL